MKSFATRKLLAVITVMIMLMTVLFFGAAIAEAGSPVNLLNNPDFEEVCDPNENEGCTFSGWYYDTTAESWSVLFTDGSAPTYSGALAAVTWCADPFVMTIGQDFTVAEAGTYEAYAWVSLGVASFDETVIRVTKGGEVVKEAAIPAAPENTDDSYRKVALKDIALEAGDYAFEVLINCAVVGDNSYARMDNAFIGVQPVVGENILANPSFEETCDPNENEGCTFSGWYYDTTAESWSVLFVDGSAAPHSGALAAVTWCADPFVMTIGQDITVAEAGIYNASAWVSLGEASFDETVIRITKDGEVVKEATIAAAPENTDDTYREICLEGIELEAGDYAFEVLINCSTVGANSFARMDDAYLGIVK